MNFINTFKTGPIKDFENPVMSQEVLNVNLPKMLQTTYKQNFATFTNWLNNNRDYQNEALEAIKNNTIGQVAIPTGTGKTRIQIASHVTKMIERTIANDWSVFVIGAHRLALCSQLMEEMLPVMFNAGIPFDILFIGSTQFPDDKVYAKFANKGVTKLISDATSTTRQDEVFSAVETAKLNKRHVICVSTYHSFDKLKLLKAIALCTYDEAHTLIGNDFFENIELVKPIIENNFFFTATRKVQGLENGMNNFSFFGNVIYSKSPREMIDRSEIVPPKLHIIQTVEVGDYNNESMMVYTVIQGYLQHEILVKQSSCDPDSIGAKLLISTTGNKDMNIVLKDSAFQQFCKDSEIKVFTYSSEYGCTFNFRPLSRDQVMTEMRSLKDDEKAIMLHIDILTEGIDLPSITGVMPFRELNTTKLLQTIGRSARLFKRDRQNLYSGVLAPMDYDNFVKPYCWVILPEHFKSLGDCDAMKNTIKVIINAYEVPEEEYSVIDKYSSVKDEKLNRITDPDSKKALDKHSELSHIIKDILTEKFHKFTEIGNPLDALKNYFMKK